MISSRTWQERQKLIQQNVQPVQLHTQKSYWTNSWKFWWKFPDILKELFLPVLGLPVRNCMFKRLFRMAPQWALCHRMLTVFKIPGQKKKDIGMCKSLYVANSGFNQPSFFFFFFGAITRDVLPVNLDWEHLKNDKLRIFVEPTMNQ